MLQAIGEQHGSLNVQGKIGFAEMARAVARRWKSISQDEKAPYVLLAEKDKQRYYREMDIWHTTNKEINAERENDSKPAARMPNPRWNPFKHTVNTLSHLAL